MVGSEATLTKDTIGLLHDNDVELVFAGSATNPDLIFQKISKCHAVLIDKDTCTGEMALKIAQEANQLHPRPLLIMTSKFRSSAMALALQAGFDEFLARPVSKGAICALLNRINI